VTLAQLIDSLVTTVQVGSLYALMAVGLTLTMAVVKLPNFAHAELITFGAYTALVVSLFVNAPPILAIGLAFPASALLAWLAQRTVYRPLQRQQASTYVLILASFAVGLIVRYALFLFADRFDLFDKRIQIPLAVLLDLGALRLTNIFVWVVPSSIALVVLLSLLLNFTSLGRQMRALADNETMARVIGLPVDRVVDLTWLLVGGMAGIAGALWGFYTFVDPLVGWLILLPVFAAAVLGGMRSFVGTIIGAYIVAFGENTIMLLLNQWFGLDFSFKPAIPFLMIILVLLIRPQGFAGLGRSAEGGKA